MSRVQKKVLSIEHYNATMFEKVALGLEKGVNSDILVTFWGLICFTSQYVI